MQKNFNVKNEVALMWDEICFKIRHHRDDPTLKENKIFSDFVTELYTTKIIQGELNDG